MAREDQGYPCYQRDMMMMMIHLINWPFDVGQWSERSGFNLKSSYSKDSKMVHDAALLNIAS